MRIVQITSLALLPEAELVARLERLRALPPELRRHGMVQLRDPELPARELLRLGRRLRELTAAVGMGLVINDRLDLARLLSADGVHLGRRSTDVSHAREFLPEGLWVSLSCHSPEEVVQAEERGADAALLSPIFATPGKGTPLGTAAIREARKLVTRRGGNIEILALGGVTTENARECLVAGADGVAGIRAELWGVAAGGREPIP